MSGKMNTTSDLTLVFHEAVQHPRRGVVGLVDDVLKLCHEQALQLDWSSDCWRIRRLGGGPDEVIDRPRRTSVFRAILARLAVLCNERSPESVSPYGGQGKLSIDEDPTALFQVLFMNTPDEQWLKLSPILPVSPLDNHTDDQQPSPIRLL